MPVNIFHWDEDKRISQQGQGINKFRIMGQLWVKRWSPEGSRWVHYNRSHQVWNEVTARYER